MMIACAQPAASAVAPNLTGEGVLVRFKPGATGSHIASVRDLHKLQIIRDFPALSASGGVILHLRSASHSDPELIALLNGDPSVAVAEPNLTRTLAAAQAPNDPLFVTQWALRNTGQPINGISGTPGADIRYLDALGMAKPNPPDTVIGILDTGIELTHLDLTPNLWTNPGEVPWDNLDNDANGKVDDVHGFNFYDNNGNPSDVDPNNAHGTHLAGIIAAAAKNSQGIAGAAFQTRFMPLRITTSTGGVDVASEIAAINYAVMMKGRGVNIVALNASFTDPNYSSVEETAIQAAGNAGIVYCCAAGNAGQDNTANPVYPANLRLPNMIVVAATDSDDSLASYSNYGTKVDLAAPGTDIHSTKTIWPNLAGVGASVIRGGTTYPAAPVYYAGTTTGLTDSVVDCGQGNLPTDYPPAVNGHIALVMRGGGIFSNKLLTAMKAGARGVVFYNHDTSPITPTVTDAKAWVPAVFLSNADGLALKAALPASVTITSAPLITSAAYKYASGTSTATPFVSAAVAFAAANYPSETAAQRVARVINGTTPVGALAGRVLSGGRLDLTGIIDGDRDQMPDWWEIQHFGSTAATAGGDPDGDGFTNLQEYRIGTLPNNPFSRFTITQAGTTAGGGFSITFPTAAEVVYRVEFSESLAAGSWAALGADVSGTGVPATVTDPAAATLHPRRFYRVRIVSP
ncbi:MAG: S8 family serine peptidase [Verrucomicrobia bacterium]|nr:S8 family serine peptidase [Verrucomicrobiota bacterium]